MQLLSLLKSAIWFASVFTVNFLLWFKGEDLPVPPFPTVRVLGTKRGQTHQVQSSTRTRLGRRRVRQFCYQTSPAKPLLPHLYPPAGRIYLETLSKRSENQQLSRTACRDIFCPRVGGAFYSDSAFTLPQRYVDPLRSHLEYISLLRDSALPLLLVWL